MSEQIPSSGSPRSVTPPPIRPMEQEDQELALQPPVLNLSVIPKLKKPNGRELLFQQQQEPPPHNQQLEDKIDDILRSAAAANRTNEELRNMLTALLPVFSLNLETLTNSNNEAEKANAQLSSMRDQNRTQIRELGEQFQLQLNQLTAQVQQQGAQIGQQLQQQGAQIGQQVQQVGEQVQQVGEQVQQVGQDVNLGRQENVVNFANVRTQIDDFRQLAVANFDDLKVLIRTAGQNAIKGCLPLDMANITEFLNTFFRCLYYFGVFMIYVFGRVKDFYMDLREKIINILLFIVGWAPIPNIDRIIRIIWLLFELSFTITVVNTIGVFFGYTAFATDVCVMVWNLLCAACFMLYQTLMWVVLKNPASQLIIGFLTEIGFFSFCNWILETLKSMKDVFIYLVSAAKSAKAVAGYLPSRFFTGGQPVSDSSFEVIDKQFDSSVDSSGVVLSAYNNDINKMMTYMHSILTGTKDPNLYKYFDTQESRDLAKDIQRHLSLFLNIVVTGNLKMLTNGTGPTIEEINGGKTRRRRFKKSATRKHRSKRSMKSKRLRRKNKKNHLKSKKK